MEPLPTVELKMPLQVETNKRKRPMTEKQREALAKGRVTRVAKMKENQQLKQQKYNAIVEMKNDIQELKRLIMEQQDAMYDYEPEISDEEYNQQMAQLKQQELEYERQQKKIELEQMPLEKPIQPVVQLVDKPTVVSLGPTKVETSKKTNIEALYNSKAKTKEEEKAIRMAEYMNLFKKK